MHSWGFWIKITIQDKYQIIYGIYLSYVLSPDETRDIVRDCKGYSLLTWVVLYLNGGAVPLNENCARLNVISRDLLGAATSCETPPARASRTLPLQRKTQWSPDQFFICISFKPWKICVRTLLYLIFIGSVTGRCNDVDPGSHYRREGDANRWGSFSTDQNWVFTVKNTGHLQCKPTTAAPVLQREAGNYNITLCVTMLCNSRFLMLWQCLVPRASGPLVL